MRENEKRECVTRGQISGELRKKKEDVTYLVLFLLPFLSPLPRFGLALVGTH